MFEYFPDNYNWSLVVCLALGIGGEMSEIDDACRPLQSIDDKDGEAGQQAWADGWNGIADRVAALGDGDLAAGHILSAARKYRRAAVYLLMAERQTAPPAKLQTYERALEVFKTTIELTGEDVELVEVPYEGVSLPSLFVPARGVDGPAPCLILFDGGGAKEIQYLMGTDAICERGVSLMITDQPGCGGALRIHGLPARPDMEVPAAACIDYLETRADVDSDRIGIAGISGGGYHAPRAASMEPRLKACVAWAAAHDVALSAAHITRTKSNSAPSFQKSWVYGMSGAAEQEKVLSQFSLTGVVDKMTCPLLVVHGEDDRQVPLEQARWTVEQATSAKSAELKVFSGWGDQHSQVDNPTLAIDYIADWVAENL